MMEERREAQEGDDEGKGGPEEEEEEGEAMVVEAWSKQQNHPCWHFGQDKKQFKINRPLIVTRL